MCAEISCCNIPPRTLINYTIHFFRGFGAFFLFGWAGSSRFSGKVVLENYRQKKNPQIKNSPRLFWYYMAKPAFWMAVKLKSIVLASAALLLAAVLLVLNWASGSYAVFFGGTTRRLPIYSVGRDDKYISISFDCAWGADHTSDILSALSAYGVKATFFTVQFWAENYPEYLLRISEEGHEVGTHSRTHPHMSQLSEEDIRSELQTSSQAISAVTGKKVELFRPPFGDYDDLLISTAEDMGLYTIQWDVDSLDWQDGNTAQSIALRVINKVQSGSIILMHNNGEHTAEAVPIILQTLIARGYKFIPIGDLIYRGNFTIDSNGRQHPLQA